MPGPVAMAAQLTGNALRFGWFYALNQMLDHQAERHGRKVAYTPVRPVPSRAEILAELRNLIVADAKAAEQGFHPPLDANPVALLLTLSRIRRMIDDLPEAARRRQAADTDSVRTAIDDPDRLGRLPGYFTQDFHFQTGGYLTDTSAQLYDIQVETLFYGAANIMRRAALKPIAREVHGKDQRRLNLIDIACGTGRFLRQVRLTYPAMRLTGLDLSDAYLDEARRHFGALRPARWLAANAEHMPLDDASQDIVTSVFLFHELPPNVRRSVTAEIARVLKPGGLFVYIDSLQMGDRPGWDGLLEAFPERFHEPYFRHYAIDDLQTMFAEAGLTTIQTELPFLAKLIVCRRN